jgi:hypothetical protein
MGERGRDDDRIWRAAFREGYRRRPKVGELERYKFWHGISRRLGCDREPIKPIVEVTASSQPVKTDPEPNIDEPVDQAEKQLPTGDGRQLNTEKPTDKSAPKTAANAKPWGAAERARGLLYAQLSDGPKSGAEIEAAAAAAEISERSLIRATDVLGVRTQRGQWWLSG